MVFSASGFKLVALFGTVPKGSQSDVAKFPVLNLEQMQNKEDDFRLQKQSPLDYVQCKHVEEQSKTSLQVSSWEQIVFLSFGFTSAITLIGLCCKCSIRYRF